MIFPHFPKTSPNRVAGWLNLVRRRGQQLWSTLAINTFRRGWQRLRARGTFKRPWKQPLSKAYALNVCVHCVGTETETQITCTLLEVSSQVTVPGEIEPLETPGTFKT